MRSLLRRIFSVSSVIWVCSFIAVVSIIAMVAKKLDEAPSVDRFGGLGEPCYPNDTCAADLACFKILTDHTCLRDAQPVINSNAKQCYNFTDKDKQEFTPCFVTGKECLSSFSRIMQDNTNTILRACFTQM